MEQIKKKITIITVVKNAQYTLENCIKSVLAQNYNNLEYIIIDGNSSDGTKEILNKYKNNISKIITEKDDGIWDAMNKGIKIASGDLIGILNADDYYNNEAFSHVIKTYNLSSKKKTIIYGDMFNEYDQTKVLSFGDLSNDAFKKGIFQINHPTVFVPRSLYEHIGFFNINFSTGADREFILRAHGNNANFVKIDKPLATFRLGGFTSVYNFKIIFDRTIEEFNILKKYYSNIFALKVALKKFYRMTRNNFYYNIYGYNNFLKARIKKLSTND